MNKKILKVITPVALMAVVGTGFSAWVFNKTAEASTNGLTVTIGTATEGGAIEISNADSAVFSIQQGTTIAKNTLATDRDKSTKYDNGLSFTFGSLQANYYNDENGRVSGDEESDKQSITRTYTVSLDSALSQYFEIKKGASGSWTDKSAVASGNADGALGTTLVIDWKDNMKPLNSTQYKAMKEVLCGGADKDTVTAKITVAFKAVVADVA